MTPRPERRLTSLQPLYDTLCLEFAARELADEREAATAIRWEAANDGFDPRTGFARAVADLLDSAPCSCPPCSCCGSVWQCDGCEPRESALAVARAYLGSDQ